jgi:hypothetical protein
MQSAVAGPLGNGASRQGRHGTTQIADYVVDGSGKETLYDVST